MFTSTSISTIVLPTPTTISPTSLSSSSNYRPKSLSLSKTPFLPFFSSPSLFILTRTGLFAFSNNFSPPPPPSSSLQMDSTIMAQTEFMVDMKCDDCVTTVKDKLLTVDGVKEVDVDLCNQVIRILGFSPLNAMTDALEQTGKNARLIAQGAPEDFVVSAAVAEFKGPDIFGVVRLTQVNMEMARVEANFSELSPGKHGWSINEFGDLTSGAASTGEVFNPTKVTKQPVGNLGILEVNENGEAAFSGLKKMLRVADLIGRSIAVYETEDRSDSGIAAAVIARCAGVGEKSKKLCACDGTTIWEASNTTKVCGFASL